MYYVKTRISYHWNFQVLRVLSRTVREFTFRHRDTEESGFLQLRDRLPQCAALHPDPAHVPDPTVQSR